MFTTILTPVDGSRASAAATRMAGELAARDGAKLVLVHVLCGQVISDDMARAVRVEHLVGERQPSPVRGDVSASFAVGTLEMDSEDEKFRVRKAVGEMLLEQSAQTVRALGVKQVESMIEDGDPAGHILARADAAGADLIVMGTRGLSDLKGLLMGSVSHKVCQLAKCPCLTVR